MQAVLASCMPAYAGAMICSSNLKELDDTPRVAAGDMFIADVKNMVIPMIDKYCACSEK
jgi:hypothetical protein